MQSKCLLVLVAGTPANACLDVSALPQLKTLCMARCALTQMPIGVYACTGLCHLDLSSNNIAEVRITPNSHFAKPRGCEQHRRPYGHMTLLQDDPAAIYHRAR